MTNDIRIASAPALLPGIGNAGRFAASRDVSYHTHPGDELVFVTGGSCRCEAGKGNWLAGDRGTLFVLPAGVPQYQENAGFTRTTYVVFRSAPTVFDSSARTIRVPPGDPFETWMEHICDLTMDADETNMLMARSLLLAGLTRLNMLEKRTERRQALHPGLGRAMQSLENGLLSAFKAEELARQAGLSVSHMNTLFRRHLGSSPLGYFQKLRIQRAQALLMGPYARVNEVAASCGYEDTNYFVRLFTRQVGIPPGKWRKRQTKAPKDAFE